MRWARWPRWIRRQMLSGVGRFAGLARLWLSAPRIYDLLGLIGVAILAAGLWLMYPPLAFLGVGGVIVGLSVYGAITWTEKRDSKSSRRLRGPG